MQTRCTKQHYFKVFLELSAYLFNNLGNIANIFCWNPLMSSSAEIRWCWLFCVLFYQIFSAKFNSFKRLKVNPVYLLLLYLTWHIFVKTGSKFEARSITIAKTASSIAIAIHGKPVLDVSLTPLPPESTLWNAGYGRRNLVCLFWTGFLGLHYTWVDASLQGLAISDSKVATPL